MVPQPQHSTTWNSTTDSEVKFMLIVPVAPAAHASLAAPAASASPNAPAFPEAPAVHRSTNLWLSVIFFPMTL